ncbi:hypothetical protein BDF19DRAFT_446142 [Syncephalis fuscata]|nr:hypothetical protein BDF19DRAFT_446142 [Syncephalis fuscata]
MQQPGVSTLSSHSRVDSYQVPTGYRALPEPPVRVTTEVAYRAALRCALLAAAPAQTPAASRGTHSTSIQSKLKLRHFSKRLGLSISSEVRPSSLSKSLVALPFSSLRNSQQPPISKSSPVLDEKRASYDGSYTSPVLPLPATASGEADSHDQAQQPAQRVDIPGGDPTKPLIKAFLRRFRARLAKVADKKAAPLSTSEPVIIEQLAKFVVNVMKQRAFKDRMQQCSTVAFLGTEFLIYCGQPAIENPYKFIRVLRDEAVDCLRYQCVSSPEILIAIDQFNAYTDYVQRTAQVTANKAQTARRKPSRIVRPYSESFGKVEILPPSPYGNYRQTLCDTDGLVEWTHRVFQVDSLENDLSVRELQLTCTPKSGVEDYQRCLAALAFNVHPTVQQDDFADSEAYSVWQQGEEQQLNQLIAYTLTANPGLLSETTPSNSNGNQVRCQYGSVYYGKNEDPRHPHYVCIPEHPRECFKTVLQACLSHEIREYKRLKDNNSLLAPISMKLLREIAIRWRIGALTRDIILLDCLCDYLSKGLVDLQHVQTTLEAINKGFKSTMAAGPLLSDKRYFYKALVRLNQLLHHRLEDRLQDMVVQKKAEQEVITLLEQIHLDESFRIEHLRILPLVKSAAEARWNRITNLQLQITDDQLDIEQLMRLVTVIQQDWLDLQTRFPIFLFDIDVVATFLMVYISHLTAKMDQWVMEMLNNAICTLDSVYPLYFSLKALKDIVLKKYTILSEFESSRWFGGFVEKWLNQLADSIPNIVTKAVAKDTFQPLSSEIRHSSSVLELFDVLKNATQFILSMQWPKEEEHAIYATRLSKILGNAVELYCIELEKYMNGDQIDETAVAVSPKQGWFGTGTRQRNSLSVPQPMDVAVESCICLSNIEAVRQKLNDLYYDLDVDEVSCIMEQSLRSKPPSADSPTTTQNYIYNVKIVLAEDLAGGDLASQQGIYAILQSGTVQMARTRTIFHTLDPSWDASFTFSLSVAVEVNAILMHRNKVCGEAIFRLQPSLFHDYFAHDIWLNLKPQGRLLLRVSMEGEKDDIRFHFGKAFRTLKRTQADMSRMIVDEISGYVRYCFGTLQQVTSIFKNGATNRRNSAIGESDNDATLSSLISYLERNLFAMSNYLRPEVSSVVFVKIWKEILQSLENLMIPPLSDLPTNMKSLGAIELDMIYTCFDSLKACFRGDDNNNNGVGLPTREIPKYHTFMFIREVYTLPNETLIERYEQAVAAHAETNSSNTRRNKSLIARRNLGTIKQLAKKKVEGGADQQDCILRVLRLRASAHKEVRHFLKDVLAKRSVSSKQEPKQPATPTV